MTTSSRVSRTRSIGMKIILLPIIGILSVLFIQGAGWYRNLLVEKGTNLKAETFQIAELSARLLYVEKEYLSTLDEKLTSLVESRSKAIKDHIESAAALSNDPEIAKAINSLREMVNKRLELFKLAGDVTWAIESDRDRLAKVNQNNNALVKELIQTLSIGNLSATNAILCDMLKEYNGFSTSVMLNISDLLAFSDKDKYDENSKALRQSMSLSAFGVDEVIASPEYEEARGKWEEVKNNQQTIFMMQDNIRFNWEQAAAHQLALKKGEEKIHGAVLMVQEMGQQFSDKVEETARLVSYGVIALSMIILVFSSFFITRRITRPVKIMTGGIQKMAEGDFSTDITYQARDEFGLMAESVRKMAEAQKSKAELANHIAEGDLTHTVALASEKDSLGKALSKMSRELNHLIQKVNETVLKVTASATEISDASQSLSQGATQQAASLEEITASMSEIGSMTKSNAENAATANQLSIEARDAGELGKGDMVKMVEAMDGISESSQAISKIIKVIDEIAFQTNLLALNAAVEAARAGKHGKGFAVVAEEVRNLAGRSAKAASETSELIESAVARVDYGVKIVRQTSKALGNIVSMAAKAADLVGEIAASSNEQAQGIAQIDQGLGQVDQVTQQNTANAEQTAASAEELTVRAHDLQTQLARFTLKSEKESAKTAKGKKPAPVLTKAEKSKPSPENGRALPAPEPDDVMQEEKGQAPSKASKKSRSETFIELDDEEFGRY